MRARYAFQGMRPAGFGCGENCACGGRCGCGQDRARGFAGNGGPILRNSDPQTSGAVARIYEILSAYVQDKISRGEPFYISPEVNSDTLGSVRGFGFAFLAPLLTVASSVATAAGAYSAVKGAQAQKKAADAANKAAKTAAADQAVVDRVIATLKEQGIILPREQAAQSVAVATRAPQAAPTIDTQTLLIIGGIGLAALLLSR